ncbi:hypothetical protein BPAE_0055g00080 [Botrytis paeoniae]|uniref:Uncharacterized protein n=1 Tax=Botrytis paeoniae TaxID=278948 RepID=A0A4Z1FSM7_9HELO|nr:hypothetical protein BPAE_0055g00080 [Botrytis paeoniae]
MFLLELPNELLGKIMLCLELDILTKPHNGTFQKWLLPLTACSKRLHKLATPGLYHTFFAKDPKTVKLFLKTIAANRNLASFVRCLYYYNEWICTKGEKGSEFLRLNETDLQRLFSKHQLPKTFETWATEDLSFWALMALASCLAPNLAGLYLRLSVLKKWDQAVSLNYSAIFLVELQPLRRPIA